MNPSPPSNPAAGAIVVGKTYDLALWIIQKVEKFPKAYRFSVGERLIDTALERVDNISTLRRRSPRPWAPSP